MEGPNSKYVKTDRITVSGICEVLLFIRLCRSLSSAGIRRRIDSTRGRSSTRQNGRRGCLPIHLGNFQKHRYHAARLQREGDMSNRPQSPSDGSRVSRQGEERVLVMKENVIK